MNPDSQQINKKLLELLTQYYDDSFSRMACDYIHATGMTPQEVVALLEAMRGSKSDRSCTTVQECKELDSNS